MEIRLEFPKFTIRLIFLALTLDLLNITLQKISDHRPEGDKSLFKTYAIFEVLIFIVFQAPTKRATGQLQWRQELLKLVTKSNPFGFI